jgi:hypothetical protein
VDESPSLAQAPEHLGNHDPLVSDPFHTLRVYAGENK